MGRKSTKVVNRETAALQKLISATKNEINAKDFYPRGNVHLDRVLLALLSKALNTAGAVCVLVKNEFAEEAFGLSRTLVEIALITRYLTNRSNRNQMDTRATRFVHYYAKVYSEWLKRARKHFPNQRFPHNIRHREFLMRARKYRSPHIWTLRPKSKRQRHALGSNVAMMARELDFHEQIDGVPIRWEFDYDWIYFWTSQYVHSTAWALNSHGVEPRESFRIHLRERIETDKPAMAVFNSAVYLLKIMVTVYRGLGHEQPSKIMDDLMALLGRLK